MKLKLEYPSYLMEGAVATLGTRTVTVGVSGMVESCGSEKESSMSMSIDVMVWRVKWVVKLDIITETLAKVGVSPQTARPCLRLEARDEGVSDEI